MNKIDLSHLDISIYHEKLDNGLNIYVAPKNDVNNIYATFTTKYGSNESEFIPIGEKKMIKVPLGIAHFLEHKMFEQEDGSDPFQFFSERGSDANANTNNFKTTYLFSGPEFFEENMNCLLDYVQSPYFTDENVEKEKGIIEQEIKMYKDNPYTMLYEDILFNSLSKNPMKDPIIGDLKSIRSITKEDLYTCYNTFYHPSNMFVVVTGNVIPEDVINIIKKNQDKKSFKKSEKIELKEYKEPDKVVKNRNVLKMNVTVPKISINYKINISKIKDISELKVKQYLSIFFDLRFGSTSLLNEQLREENIISDNLETSPIDTKTHIIYSVFGETNKEEKLIKAVEKEIKNLKITEEELERRKKAHISSSIMYISDNIFGLNGKIMNDIVRYKKIISDNFEQTKSLNLEEFNKVISKIDFNNYNVVIVEKDN